MTKTVRVRIAVAIATTGHWNCCGYNSRTSKDIEANEADMLAMAGDLYDNDHEPIDEHLIRYYWIEADVPIPDDIESVIAGTVAKADTR